MSHISALKKERRNLLDNILVLHAGMLVIQSEPNFSHNYYAHLELDRMEDEYHVLMSLFNQCESKILMKKAIKWGIEVPNKPEWFTQRIKNPDPAKIPGATILVEYPWLNETGRAVITKQIRDTRFAYWKGWAEILIPILSLVVAILALFRDAIIAYINS